MRCKLPGPQLPAQTARLPVMCASAPAAKAATSSWRTCSHSIPPRRRMASVKPFKTVADDAVDAVHACRGENLDHLIGDGLGHHFLLR